MEDTTLSISRNTLTGAAAILTTLAGVALAGGVAGTQMSCHANCNHNQRNCDPGTKTCCCGGGGGTYGTCTCTSQSNCTGQDCHWGNFPKPADPGGGV